VSSGACINKQTKKLKKLELVYGHIDAGLGTSIDLKSADKELKAMTPEKSKTCVTAFIKRLVTNFQLSRTRKGPFLPK